MAAAAFQAASAGKCRRALALISLLAACLSAHGLSPSDAVSLQNRGNWAGAESIWRSLVQSHPSDYRYWTSLGVCLAHQRRFTEAITDYKHALALSPRDPQTNFNLGLAYFKLGKLNQAIAPLRVAAKAFSGNSQLDLLLGMSLYGTAQYVAAAPYLAAAQGRNPDNAELQLVLARTYLLSGEYGKAKEQFRLMLVRDPDSPEVHLLLGEAYDGLGKEPQARSEFQAAAEKGNVPGAHFALGYLLWRDKNYKQAAFEFRQELAHFPEQYMAQAYLGDSLLKQGDQQEAAKWIGRSIGIKDVLWITHYDLGVMAAERHDYVGALSEFRNAIRRNGKRAEAHYHLAQVYRALGKHAQAQAELQIVKRLHSEQNQQLIIQLHSQRESAAANNTLR